LAALTGTSIDALVEQFAGRGYGDLKSAVADAVTEFAVPYRNRTFQLMEERGELETILAKGADRARDVASATLADVYAKVGVA
jgi:tryptophanyl-tRNA synthetase